MPARAVGATIACHRNGPPERRHRSWPPTPAGTAPPDRAAPPGPLIVCRCARVSVRMRKPRASWRGFQLAEETVVFVIRPSREEQAAWRPVVPTDTECERPEAVDLDVTTVRTA